MPQAPIDVGIITSHMSFDEHGGANYSRHVLGQQLEARGHDVTIYTLNFSDENCVPVSHDYDLVESRVNARTVFDGGIKFRRMVGEYFDAHDLLHLYVPGIIPFFGWHKRRSGDDTPVVAHLNGYTPFCTATDRMADGCWQNCTLSKKLRHGRQSPTSDMTIESVARAAFNDTVTVAMMNELDGYFCLSPTVRRIYRDLGVDDDLLDVVPNMLDPDFTTTEPTPQGGGPVRLLYVGRVDAMKSIDTLLDGLAAIDTGQSWRADIVGANVLDYGQDLDGYRRDANALGLADRVTFHGWVDYTELSPYYADADVFIHPAKWPEPFGRTIIEALEHDLPVVSSRVGAPPWIAGSAAVSFEREDPAALGDTLTELIETPERRHAMAANATMELQRFTPDRVMGDILRTYRHLLARPAVTGGTAAVATDGGNCK